MEMQIPKLRQLFEAHVGQISSVLSKDPPPEIGNVDMTLRGLKGFLLALEGMLRKNELQGLPFSARQELFARVDRVLDAMQALPEKLDHQQAMAVMRGMDNLHRLCLQENLMASGMDASKLGKLTVILEHKLGGVLESIDGVAETARGHVERIEQAARERLAEIQGAYKKESEVLEGSASLAVESIRSQAESIQQRQAEVMAQIDDLQQELIEKRRQWQARLDEQLVAAQEVVDEAQGRQKSIQELLNRTQTQLGAAEAAIREMGAITQAAEDARKDLQAKLADGDEVITSIRGLLESGTRAGGELSSKAAAAQQCLAGVEKTKLQCEQFADEARRKLDSHFESAEKVLSDIHVRGEAVADATAETRQRRQEAAEAAEAAAESRRQADGELARIEALSARGVQSAEQIEALARTGGDMKARMAQTLAEANQARERIGQVEAEVSESAAEVRRRKQEAVETLREAIADAQGRQRQFEQAVSQWQQAAHAAVADLRGNQAIGADMLGRTRQDVESLQAEIGKVHELRLAAEQAGSDVRARLDEAGGVVKDLGAVLAQAGEVKVQVDAHLAGSAEVRRRLEQLERETTAAAEDMGCWQAEALAALRGQASAAGEQRKALEAALGEQLESARAVVVDLRAGKEVADGLAEQARQQRDAAMACAQAAGEARHAVAEAGGEVQGRLAEARRAASDLAGLLKGGAETRSAIDRQLDAARRTGGEIGQVRREAGELLDHVRRQRQEVDDARQQSQQMIAVLQSDAGGVLDRLAGQTSDLVARNERLRQELEEMMGQAADGGLFRQFDELAGQSAPRLRKWLWLLIGGGASGAAVTAGGSALLTSVSIWAAGAVLVAGLVPLVVFLGFCAVQYGAERRAQTRHRYRAALSRSLTAYRKLLVTMQAEGIAESAYADRMLSELFGAAAAKSESRDLPSANAETPES
jgi:chromosome segregation ATPase